MECALIRSKMSGGSVCKICATVPTGLEYGAADECREVLGDNAHVQHQRGRLSFLLHSLEELEKARKCTHMHARGFLS